MPVGYLNSTTLIETVKRDAMIPTSQSTFVDADFLALANQEMRIGLVPSILQYHQEYYVRDSAPLDIVENQSNYSIPYRAVGGKFRELFFRDTNGNLIAMTRISPDDRPYYQQSTFQNRFIYFYIKGNDVVLVPDVGSNVVGSLVFSFFMRPNELVSPTRIATISNIAIDTLAGTTTYTVDRIPTGFTTSINMDVLQTNPGHKTISFDVIPTAIDTTNKMITFTTTDLTSGAIAGDYVAFAGECIIPQAPADLHDVLAQRVVTRCLQALGDTAGLGIALQKLAEMEKYTGTLLDNRAEGQPVKATNLHGTLRTSKLRRRGWL